MCIYTVEKQKLKNSSRVVRDTTERPKIRRLEEFFNFCFLSVNMHIFERKIMKNNRYKKR